MEIKKPKTIIIGFLIIAIIFFLFSDKIVAYVSTLAPLSILFISIFLSPLYVVFIYLMYKSYGITGAVAGFLISSASDIISLPHVLTMSGGYSQASYSLITDSIFYHILPQSLKHVVNLPLVGAVNLAVFLVYVVVSTLLVILGLMLVTKKNFKEVFFKSV